MVHKELKDHLKNNRILAEVILIFFFFFATIYSKMSRSSAFCVFIWKQSTKYPYSILSQCMHMTAGIRINFLKQIYTEFKNFTVTKSKINWEAIKIWPSG